jgi:hypothetical protein
MADNDRMIKNDYRRLCEVVVSQAATLLECNFDYAIADLLEEAQERIVKRIGDPPQYDKQHIKRIWAEFSKSCLWALDLPLDA